MPYDGFNTQSWDIQVVDDLFWQCICTRTKRAWLQIYTITNAKNVLYFSISIPPERVADKPGIKAFQQIYHNYTRHHCSFFVTKSGGGTIFSLRFAKSKLVPQVTTNDSCKNTEGRWFSPSVSLQAIHLLVISGLLIPEQELITRCSERIDVLQCMLAKTTSCIASSGIMQLTSALSPVK